MAVRLTGWIETANPFGVAVEMPAESLPSSLRMTRRERLARLQRRRRMGQAQVVLEGAAWLAVTAAVSLLAVGGIFGLR